MSRVPPWDDASALERRLFGLAWDLTQGLSPEPAERELAAQALRLAALYNALERDRFPLPADCDGALAEVRRAWRDLDRADYFRPRDEEPRSGVTIPEPFDCDCDPPCSGMFGGCLARKDGDS